MPPLKMASGISAQKGIRMLYFGVVGCLMALQAQNRGVVCQLVFTLVLHIVPTIGGLDVSCSLHLGVLWPFGPRIGGLYVSWCLH